jgi:hypothetical protein
MSDARRNDDELREHLRRAESDFRNRRLHMLAETRQAAFALRRGAGMQMWDARSWPVTVNRQLS